MEIFCMFVKTFKDLKEEKKSILSSSLLKYLKFLMCKKHPRKHFKSAEKYLFLIIPLKNIEKIVAF